MGGMYEVDQPMKREDLGNVIFIAESEKTPFSRLIKRGARPKQMLGSWPVQAYPRRKFSGTMDGVDISTFNSTTRQDIEAYAMLMRTEGWLVSRLAKITDAAGVNRNEKAKQMADDGLILAQMIERNMLSNVDTQAQSGQNTPYRSRGAFSWLASAEQSTKPVPADFRPSTNSRYTDALADLTPALFEGLLESAATEKRAPVDLDGFCGLALKRQMSTWAQRDTEASATDQALVTYNLNASEKKLMQVVDFFEFDAGMVRTLLSFYLRCTEATGEDSDYTTRSGLFLDMSMWEVGFMDQPAAYMAKDEGGGPRGYHDAVYVTKCLNPLGQVVVETDS